MYQEHGWWSGKSPVSERINCPYILVCTRAESAESEPARSARLSLLFPSVCGLTLYNQAKNNYVSPILNAVLGEKLRPAVGQLGGKILSFLISCTWAKIKANATVRKSNVNQLALAHTYIGNANRMDGMLGFNAIIHKNIGIKRPFYKRTK